MISVPPVELFRLDMFLDWLSRSFHLSINLSPIELASYPWAYYGSLFDIRHHIINIALLVCFSPLDNAHERRGWVEMGCCLRAFFPCGYIPSPAQGVTCTGHLCEIRGAGLA